MKIDDMKLRCFQIDIKQEDGTWKSDNISAWTYSDALLKTQIKNPHKEIKVQEWNMSWDEFLKSVGSDGG